MVRPRGIQVEASSVFGIFWSTVFVCTYGCVRHGEYTAGESSLLPTAFKSTLYSAISARYCWMDLLSLVEASSLEVSSQPIGATHSVVWPAILSRVKKGYKPNAGDSGHNVLYSMSVVLFMYSMSRLVTHGWNFWQRSFIWLTVASLSPAFGCRSLQSNIASLLEIL